MCNLCNYYALNILQANVCFICPAFNCIYSSDYENFRGTIDPEELFRKIFGDAGFKMSGFRDFSDFEESKYGFAPASEVRLMLFSGFDLIKSSSSMAAAICRSV